MVPTLFLYLPQIRKLMVVAHVLMIQAPAIIVFIILLCYNLHVFDIILLKQAMGHAYS